MTMMQDISNQFTENNYTFYEFSDGDLLTFTIPMTLEELYRFDDGIISFFTVLGQKYDLENDYILDALRKLCFFIYKILEGEWQLHSCITQDIGYQWNEYLQGTTNFEEEKPPGCISSWVGCRYLLWESSRDCKTDCATWLYRKEDKIFFEITPEYPWSLSEPQEGDKFIPYEEFIKNYKPYVVKELSEETLRQMLKRAQEIMDGIASKDHLYFPPGTTF